MIDGKVVTSSMYRKNFKLNKDGNDIPPDMIKFVEDRCKEYMPHKVFAMDIALVVEIIISSSVAVLIQLGFIIVTSQNLLRAFLIL